MAETSSQRLYEGGETTPDNLLMNEMYGALFFLNISEINKPNLFGAAFVINWHCDILVTKMCFVQNRKYANSLVWKLLVKTNKRQTRIICTLWLKFGATSSLSGPLGDKDPRQPPADPLSDNLSVGNYMGLIFS